MKTAKKAKSTRASTAKQPSKICDRCGTENPPGADACEACGKDRFAPNWVRALRHITRNFLVQVTQPSEESTNQDLRVTLYKWWPGGKGTVHINSQEHWEQIKEIIDTELAGHLGWSSKAELSAEIEARRKEQASFDAEAKEILGANPELLVKIAEGLKLESIDPEDLPRVADSLGQIAGILAGVDESHQLAIRQLVEKLPKQKAAAIAQLSELMNDLTIGQITAVTNEVRRRVALLETFTDRINDERTYEINGDESVHRLLERAMWIVDERYWLMHSNRQLRTVVTDEMAKEDKKLRPNGPISSAEPWTRG